MLPAAARLEAVTVRVLPAPAELVYAMLFDVLFERATPCTVELPVSEMPRTALAARLWLAVEEMAAVPEMPPAEAVNVRAPGADRAVATTMAVVLVSPVVSVIAEAKVVVVAADTVMPPVFEAEPMVRPAAAVRRSSSVPERLRAAPEPPSVMARAVA